MDKLTKAIKNNLYGDESWIVIGNEQHKRFWYALIGNSGNWNTVGNGITKDGVYIMPDLMKKQEFEASIVLTADTLNELLQKISKMSKMEEYDTYSEQDAGKGFLN